MHTPLYQFSFSITPDRGIDSARSALECDDPGTALDGYGVPERLGMQAGDCPPKYKGKHSSRTVSFAPRSSIAVPGRNTPKTPSINFARSALECGDPGTALDGYRVPGPPRNQAKMRQTK